MKVSLIEPLNVSKNIIDSYGKKIEDMGHEFTYYDEKTSDNSELIERSMGQDIVMIANNPYPGEVIKAADKLKLLNVAFTGVDHVDLAAAKEKGIDICNASGYSDIAVAELVIGLVVAIYRNLKSSDSEIRQGGMPRIGREISGKKVGILGTGNIGIETAKIFSAFGADLVGYDREEKEKFKDLGGAYLALEDLLKESDIISIHLPVTEDTFEFIGKDELAMMKDDAILINCARGKIADNAALAQALNSGQIAGAGIDVFDMEPPIPEDYPLLSAENTILTPHIAYLTEESMLRRADIAFENTISYLNGQGKNIVDL